MSILEEQRRRIIDQLNSTQAEDEEEEEGEEEEEPAEEEEAPPEEIEQEEEEEEEEEVQKSSESSNEKSLSEGVEEASRVALAAVLGSPVCLSQNAARQLPDVAKFSAGIEEFRPNEESGELAGTYQKLMTALREAKRGRKS